MLVWKNKTLASRGWESETCGKRDVIYKRSTNGKLSYCLIVNAGILWSVIWRLLAVILPWLQGMTATDTHNLQALHRSRIKHRAQPVQQKVIIDSKWYFVVQIYVQLCWRRRVITMMKICHIGQQSHKIHSLKIPVNTYYQQHMARNI
jgi:hypothetical protein